jgi:hypothetical protein
MTTINAFFTEFVKELQGFMGIGLLACGVLLIKMIRDYIGDCFANVFKNFAKKMTFKETAGLIRYIDDRLVELRTILNADRAYIHEFRNGDHFSAKNPVWRIFRTYEKCKEGIVYHSSTLKGEQVTSMFDIIEPVITGTSRCLGVSVMDCSNCSLSCNYRNTIIYNIEKMPHTVSKQMMINHNVKFSIQVNLSINDCIIGIIALDFCDDLNKGLVDDKVFLHNCCKIINEYADKIEYCLATPNKFKN